MPFANGGAHAPVGQTLVLREQHSHDHLSSISGITLGRGKLSMREEEGALKGQYVVGFLKQHLRKIAGTLLMIRVSLPLHRASVEKGLLAGGAAKRLQLESLLGNAAELDPDEVIGERLTGVALKNVCRRNLSDLHKPMERLGHLYYVVLGCIRQPAFEL